MHVRSHNGLWVVFFAIEMFWSLPFAAGLRSRISLRRQSLKIFKDILLDQPKFPTLPQRLHDRNPLLNQPPRLCLITLGELQQLPGGPSASSGQILLPFRIQGVPLYERFDRLHARLERTAGGTRIPLPAMYVADAVICEGKVGKVIRVPRLLSRHPLANGDTLAKRFEGHFEILRFQCVLGGTLEM